MRDYTRKAKIKDSNEWVIGYHVYVDYLDKHYILASEKTHDGFRGMLAMKQYEVDGDTICNPPLEVDKRKQVKVARKALKQISLVDLEDIFKKIVNGIARGFKVLGEMFINAGNRLEGE